MPENNPLPEDMRVSEYLYYRGRLKEIVRKKLGPRIDEVLELCDLKRVRHRIIGKLSKGFRQRVGIAEAILAEPPVIIMDEPTIGLDPHQILIVRDLIRSLRGRMTVIISSHILHEVDRISDQVILLSSGYVVAEGWWSPYDARTQHVLYSLTKSFTSTAVGLAMYAHRTTVAKISQEHGFGSSAEARTVTYVDGTSSRTVLPSAAKTWKGSMGT